MLRCKVHYSRWVFKNCWSCGSCYIMHIWKVVICCFRRPARKYIW